LIRKWDLYYSEESCKIMVDNLGLSATPAKSHSKNSSSGIISTRYQNRQKRLVELGGLAGAY